MPGALQDELQRQAPWDLGAALLGDHLQLGQGILCQAQGACMLHQGYL